MELRSSARLGPRSRGRPRAAVITDALSEATAQSLGTPSAPGNPDPVVAALRTLGRARELTAHLERVVLETDEKATYPRLLARVFGARRVVHRTTSGELARGSWNPLFPINHTEAMLRDLAGRLRRESWLVSKRRRYLDLGLQVHMAYRNYVRRRFNRDRQSAAEILGFLPQATARRVALLATGLGAQAQHPSSPARRRLTPPRPPSKTHPARAHLCQSVHSISPAC